MPDAVQGVLDELPDWLTQLLWMAVAAGVAWLAACIALKLLRRLFQRSTTMALVFERLCAPIRRGAALAAMLLTVPFAPDDRAFELLYRLIAVLLVVDVTWGATRVIGTLSYWIMLRHPVDVADNLSARRLATQSQVITRALNVVVVLLGAAGALSLFPNARQIGASLLASAGVAGLAVGFAAKPLFANLIAGIQIALTQPIRIDDVVCVEKEWGRIEELGSAYVVVKLWDERRLIVPLNYFLEHPFENWTRQSAERLGAVYLWVDFRIPLDDLRRELERICRGSERWDRRLCRLQVTDAKENAMQLRALVSAANPDRAFDLRCEVREGLLRYLVDKHGDAVARLRG